MSLRLSSHLLSGLSRIFTRKVQFLFTDCNEALSKITLVGLWKYLGFSVRECEPGYVFRRSDRATLIWAQSIRLRSSQSPSMRTLWFRWIWILIWIWMTPNGLHRSKCWVLNKVPYNLIHLVAEPWRAKGLPQKSRFLKQAIVNGQQPAPLMMKTRC